MSITSNFGRHSALPRPLAYFSHVSDFSLMQPQREREPGTLSTTAARIIARLWWDGLRIVHCANVWSIGNFELNFLAKQREK